MRRSRPFSALFLALTLLISLALPARAAGVRLTWEKKGASSFALAVRGLGEESVYGVQLELTVAGRYTSASFTPASRDAYSPECRLSASEERTSIVIYLTSQTPLNEGGLLRVGTLTLDRAFDMPSSVMTTLLGHELKVLPVADRAALSASEQTDPVQTPDWDDEDDAPETYRVRVSSAAHGAVKSDTVRTESRSTVTLTVEPEDRYGLKELKVVTAAGKVMSLTDVGGNRYTFRMPAADVEVTAAFEWTGLTHEPMHFSDVSETDWYHDAVHYVYERSMMSGTTDSAFSPDMDTSRGMIVTVLHRLEGMPQAEPADFSDVDAEEYYAVPVGWALKNGIVSGYGGAETGTFGPGNRVTREQLASILYRHAQWKGYNASVRGDLSVFEDYDSISDYAREPLSWAVGVGLISGMGDGSISPNGSATRAQTATILARYCQNIAE